MMSYINEYMQKQTSTKKRVEYLLAKYSLKANKMASTLPEPDTSSFLDDDPGFLPFYAKI